MFDSANEIGTRVASDTKMQAIIALLASTIGIIIYIWVRFQHLMFGLAAIIALVHDTLITIGFVAMSYYWRRTPGLFGHRAVQDQHARHGGHLDGHGLLAQRHDRGLRPHP